MTIKNLFQRFIDWTEYRLRDSTGKAILLLAASTWNHAPYETKHVPQKPIIHERVEHVPTRKHIVKRGDTFYEIVDNEINQGLAMPYRTRSERAATRDSVWKLTQNNNSTMVDNNRIEPGQEIIFTPAKTTIETISTPQPTRTETIPSQQPIPPLATLGLLAGLAMARRSKEELERWELLEIALRGYTTPIHYIDKQVDNQRKERPIVETPELVYRPTYTFPAMRRFMKAAALSATLLLQPGTKETLKETAQYQLPALEERIQKHPVHNTRAARTAMRAYTTLADTVTQLSEQEATPLQRAMTLGADMNGGELIPSTYRKHAFHEPTRKEQQAQYRSTRERIAADLREQGMKVKDIIESLGISKTTYYNDRKRYSMQQGLVNA